MTHTKHQSTQTILRRSPVVNQSIQTLQSIQSVSWLSESPENQSRTRSRSESPHQRFVTQQKRERVKTRSGTHVKYSRWIEKTSQYVFTTPGSIFTHTRTNKQTALASDCPSTRPHLRHTEPLDGRTRRTTPARPRASTLYIPVHDF